LLHEGRGAFRRIGIEPVSHGGPVLTKDRAAGQEKPSEVIEFAVRKFPGAAGVFGPFVCYSLAFDLNNLGADFTAGSPGRKYGYDRE
jgi:hypothetical protein